MMPRPPSPRPLRLLVLGGARSGKSRFAQDTARRLWRRPLYLATAEPLDAEMADRVRRHRRARGPRWRCVEAPLEVARALRRGAPDADGVLVDCLTVWLSNVRLREGRAGCRRRQAELLAALRGSARGVILVANEVGLGVVPVSPLGREFRDLAGRLNQAVARAVDTVVFLAAGLPLVLKGRLPE